MDLKIDRDEEKCLECDFKDADMFGHYGRCLLFKESLVPRIKYGDVDYYKPCNECNLAWRK